MLCLFRFLNLEPARARVPFPEVKPLSVDRLLTKARSSLGRGSVTRSPQAVNLPL